MRVHTGSSEAGRLRVCLEVPPDYFAAPVVLLHLGTGQCLVPVATSSVIGSVGSSGIIDMVTLYLSFRFGDRHGTPFLIPVVIGTTRHISWSAGA